MALTNVQRALGEEPVVHPPQQFTQAELPDPQAAIDAGLIPQRIPPDQILEE